MCSATGYVHWHICEDMCWYVCVCVSWTHTPAMCVFLPSGATHICLFACCVCVCDCVLWVPSFSGSDLQWWCEEQRSGRAAILVMIYERERKRGKDWGWRGGIKDKETDWVTTLESVWWWKDEEKERVQYNKTENSVCYMTTLRGCVLPIPFLFDALLVAVCFLQLNTGLSLQWKRFAAMSTESHDKWRQQGAMLFSISGLSRL